MDGNTLDFTAIRGIQAGAAYYVIMVPLKAIPRLFRFDDAEVPANLRAQRVLNRSRVPEIARYIGENASEYILSSLCASVDGDMEFEASAAEGPLRAVGRLRISMTATILVNDGQHRRAAIEEAVRERPLLGDETISVVVFPDRGLRRSQQMFADLNIHAVRPTRSIKLLYDHRDGLAALSREVIGAVPLFRDFTCFDSASISNRSLKLFTFSSIHQATAELLGKPRDGGIARVDAERAIAFWEAVVAGMPDWRRVGARQVASAELRRDYVHAHGIATHAIGLAGRRLIEASPDDWGRRLSRLGTIDWSRANAALWEGRALIGGKVNKSRTNVVLVGNVVLAALGVEPDEEAARIEALHAPRAAGELELAG